MSFLKKLLPNIYLSPLKVDSSSFQLAGSAALSRSDETTSLSFFGRLRTSQRRKERNRARPKLNAPIAIVSPKVNRVSATPPSAIPPSSEITPELRRSEFTLLRDLVPRPTTATTVELTPASFIKLDTPRINRQTNRIEKDGRVKRKTATEMQAISRRKFATVIALTPGKRSIDPATTRPKTNAAADSIRLRQATCIGVAWNISRAISGTANTATCIPIAPHNSAPASTNTGLKDHFLLLFITKVDRHGVSFPRLTKVLLYLMIMVAR